MGDYRITIEAIGGHGCGREAKDGEVVTRCGQPYCPDCKTIAFVADLAKSGNSVSSAVLEHWPVPGAAGTTRTEKPGPVDDLLSGIRVGQFGQAPAPVADLVLEEAPPSNDLDTALGPPSEG